VRGGGVVDEDVAGLGTDGVEIGSVAATGWWWMTYPIPDYYGQRLGMMLCGF
jgi:hypothetical protein